MEEKELIRQMQKQIEELQNQISDKNNDNDVKKIEFELGRNTYDLSNKYINYKIITGIIVLVLSIIFFIWMAFQFNQSRINFNRSWNESQKNFNKHWDKDRKQFNKEWYGY